MSRPVVSCDGFDDGVDELALGLLDEPERGRLLAHAAGCPHCQARLDDLVALTERLLLVAPEMDPPAGFEGRTLERMGVGGAPASDGRRRAHPVGRWIVAAVSAVAVLAAGFGVGRWVTEGSTRVPPRERGGAIVSSAGAEVGTVTLVLEPEPHVLVAIDQPRRAPDTRTCQLRLPGEGWVTVGTWSYDEIATGIWAVGVDPALLGAAAMQIVGADGQVLASAAIS